MKQVDMYICTWVVAGIGCVNNKREVGPQRHQNNLDPQINLKWSGSVTNFQAFPKVQMPKFRHKNLMPELTWLKSLRGGKAVDVLDQQHDEVEYPQGIASHGGTQVWLSFD